MIVVPKQLLTLACALDTKESGLDSNEFSQICEQSLTWRGKDSQSRTWLQRWKRGDWIKHLCLRTLKPSHTESFVASWTSYLAGSRASPSALLESVTELKTLDTCFHSLPRESDNADQKLFSSKTWKELSQQKHTTGRAFSNMSSERWKTWITAQRQEYSQRVKSAHHTNESASLSWATPEAPNQVGYQTSNGKKFWRLGSQVKHWPTPTTAEGTKIGNKANYGQIGLSNHPAIVGLPDREKLNKSGKSQESWPTPSTSDDRRGASSRQQGINVVAHPQNKGNKLNPSWVEQIMGIPVGWTALGSWGME